MVKKTSPRLPPTGWRKILWRAPIYLFHIGLGPLFGKKFLLLNHIGRKSHQRRQAVLEIDRYDPETNTYIVASGFGKKSDWYRNVLTHPEVVIQVKNNKLKAIAEPLSPIESGEEMRRYAQAHPHAAKELSSLIGIHIEDANNPEEWRIAGEKYIPFVAFHIQKSAT